jgi:hypothetical protein
LSLWRWGSSGSEWRFIFTIYKRSEIDQKRGHRE